MEGCVGEGRDGSRLPFEVDSGDDNDSHEAWTTATRTHFFAAPNLFSFLLVLASFVVGHVWPADRPAGRPLNVLFSNTLIPAFFPPEIDFVRQL